MSVPKEWSLGRRLAHYSEDIGGCRIWRGGSLSLGYGLLKWRGKSVRAHRLAWQDANGPIPAGKFVCHKCDVRACINLDHLFLGTHDDNMADRTAKGRQSRGVTHGRAKLTAAQVLSIRESSGPAHKIAAAFGVSRSLVGAIRNREYWTHL